MSNTISQTTNFDFQVYITSPMCYQHKRNMLRAKLWSDLIPVQDLVPVFDGCQYRDFSTTELYRICQASGLTDDQTVAMLEYWAEQLAEEQRYLGLVYDKTQC